MATKRVYKAYRCRLYPTAEQEAYFRRMFGCCRLVYNHFLQERIDAWEARKADPVVTLPGRFEQGRALTALKRERLDADGHAFLKDVDATALVYELQHLDVAFRRFYRLAQAGKAAGGAGFPRFKKRGDRDSATLAFKRMADIQRRRMRFAKVGWVGASVWREMEGTPVSCTVSVDAAGRWWASVLCRGVPVRELPPADQVATVQLASVGTALEAAVQDAALARRIRRERRRLARRRPPQENRAASARYLRQKDKLGRLVARERDRLRTHTDQLTARLVRESGTIVIEGCAKAKRTPAETELVRQLRYKCAWAGRELVERE